MLINADIQPQYEEAQTLSNKTTINYGYVILSQEG